MNPKIILAFIIAIFLDITDIVAFAWLPVVGDVLDLFGIGILFLLTRSPVVAIAVLELVPFADFLPIHTVAVALSQRKWLGKFGGE